MRYMRSCNLARMVGPSSTLYVAAFSGVRVRTGKDTGCSGVQWIGLGVSLAIHRGYHVDQSLKATTLFRVALRFALSEWHLILLGSRND